MSRLIRLSMYLIILLLLPINTAVSLTESTSTILTTETRPYLHTTITSTITAVTTVILVPTGTPSILPSSAAYAPSSLQLIFGTAAIIMIVLFIIWAVSVKKRPVRTIGPGMNNEVEMGGMSRAVETGGGEGIAAAGQEGGEGGRR